LAGGAVFLSSLNTGFGSTSILGYVNKEWMWTESTDIAHGLLEISEVTPQTRVNLQVVF
jgi:hypothetical protein